MYFANLLAVAGIAAQVTFIILLLRRHTYRSMPVSSSISSGV